MNSPVTDWPAIVRTHGPMAFDTAWRLLGHAADTEDVVQDALMDAFRLHARQPVNNWGGVLRHLVTRRAIDRLRKRRATEKTSPDVCERMASQSEHPESVAVERELAERLRGAIADLADQEAQVFSLYYFGAMSNDEIGETLGISAEAVAVALHKARKNLKERLDIQPTAARRP